MKNTIMIVRLFILYMLFCAVASAQLVVDNSMSSKPEKLMKKYFLGEGVDIINISYFGSSNPFYPSIGYFDGSGSNIGINFGILINTGAIWEAVGPNRYYDVSNPYFANRIGDRDLTRIIRTETYDATSIVIDFKPVNRKMEFKYVFGSDEYEEFVCSEFNDAFAFLVSGPGIDGVINIARVPDSDDIVSINTINNGCHNARRDSTDWCGILPVPCYPMNSSYYINNEFGQTIEYDGFTQVLTAKIDSLTPGETYRMKIVIADASDGLYNSGVFLVGGSFYGNHTLDFSGMCMFDTIYFTSDVTRNATLWEWDFGDGEKSNLENPVHYYRTPGDYKVTLIVVYPDITAPDTLVRYIYINEPKADFSYSREKKAGTQISFTDNSLVINGEIDSWEWDFGDGGTSTEQNPVYNYGDLFSHNVRLIITTENGCQDTIYKTLEPGTIMTAADTSCIGDPVSFRILSGRQVTGCDWAFGDGEASTDSMPIHYYTNPGIYDAQVIVTFNNSTKDTLLHTISISDVTADFEYDLNSLVSASFTDRSFADNDTITSRTWSFGDGQASAELNPVHDYSSAGTYKVLLIVESANGCLDTLEKTITLPYNVMTIDGSCAKQAVYFSIASTWTNYSVHWDFGDGGSSDENNPVYYYSAPGTYKVTAIVDNTDDMTHDTLTQSVEIFGVKAACEIKNGSGANPEFLFYDKSTYTGDPIVSWYWNFGDGNVSSQQNTVHQYASIGTYKVTLIVMTENGCRDTLVTDLDVSSYSNKLLIETECAGIPCDFDVETYWDIASCKWDFGDGSTSDQKITEHIYYPGGDYSIRAIIADKNGKQDTLDSTVRIDQALADFSYHKDKSFSLETNFTDQSTSLFSNIIAWFWDFGDGSRSKLQNPSHTYADNKSKKVYLIITNENGCQDTMIKILNRIEVSQNCAGKVSYFFYQTDWPNSSCEWDFGDGTGSTEKSPEHTYNTPGDYTVRAIIKNTGSSELDTIIQIVNIAGAKADFLPTAVSGSFLYRFQDISTVFNGTITAWYWNFGDGSVSSDQNPEHEYQEYGNFKVTLIITTDYGCQDTVRKLINNYGRASCTVTMPDTCLNTGDTLLLPLFLDSQSYLTPNENFSFEAKIRFDKSVLLPLPDNSHQYSFEGDDCILTVTGTRNSQLADYRGKKVLAWLRLFVLLGSRENIDIQIDSFKWTDGYDSDITTDNSTFCVLDLCKAAGTRLYFGTGSVALMEPRPNPASDAVEIEYEVVGDGKADLFICDMTGKQVAVLVDNTVPAGRYSISYRTSGLPSGVYYITLKTLSETVTKKFSIVK